MDTPIDRPSPGDLITDLRRLGARVQIVERELEGLPWYGALAAAVRGTKKLRVALFLEALGRREERCSDADRQKFAKFVASAEGQELLTDYAESTVRTGSRIAIAALGLLYGDPDFTQYPLSFRWLACEALTGISDELVRIFLAMMDVAETLLAQPREGHWNVYKVDGGIVDPSGPFAVVMPYAATLAAKAALDEAKLYPALHYLLSRGLLLPDPSTGRLGGDPVLAYGIGEDARRFQELLTAARDMLVRTPNDVSTASREPQF